MSLVILFLLYAIGYVAAFKFFKIAAIDSGKPEEYTNLMVIVNLFLSVFSWVLVFIILPLFVLHTIHENGIEQTRDWLDKKCTSKWL